MQNILLSQQIKQMEQYDNKTKYNPDDINLAKIYEVQESFKSQDKMSNLVVCQEFISPGCISSNNNQIYTIEQIANTSIVNNATDKKFYIPYKTFKYFTDKPLTTKEAAQLLYNLTEEEFFEIIDEDYEEEQLNSISVDAKIKKLSKRYI